MGIKYDSVIVFGPTGAVGSAVAVEAGKRGAKVWLAMRDTTKAIPGLEESSGKFERVQADLSDAESVKRAVSQSGAKAAFFYQVRTKDGMKLTIGAMKESGIEYVVFLSSLTILPDDDIRAITPDKIIPFAHSSVEVTIEDLGLPSTMLRAGAFAHNIIWQNLDRSSEPWKAKIPISERKSDGIVQKDIGRVGGAVLVERPSESQKEIIYLYGPELLTREEQLTIIEKVSGKKIETEVQSFEEYGKYMLTKGFPEFIVNYLLKADNGDRNDAYYANGRHEEGVANVKKYSGYEATTYEGYVREFLTKAA
ncbi:uncharacterized protein PV09_05659 [Verruconis gallopava]|uniref:NmrA-like domain-containing protein n=1 Tax=Verruconis gallopava TaxID=253628 RepID=A0A0D1XL03_9PEZI|nr:uncharacterized protein PV09_05659 [Verruconis gallopava]KIW03001.1 hypothetical protein PV09_05659 [Verruconis gallopava]